MKQPLYKQLSSVVTARLNCYNRNPPYFSGFEKHGETATQLAKNYLPSGAGIDNGTQINFNRSTGDKLVLECGFHHMDENGMYDKWTDHTIVITPSLMTDFHIHVTGPNKNDIKEHLRQTFDHALRQEVEV